MMTRTQPHRGSITHGPRRSGTLAAVALVLIGAGAVPAAEGHRGQAAGTTAEPPAAVEEAGLFTVANRSFWFSEWPWDRLIAFFNLTSDQAADVRGRWSAATQRIGAAWDALNVDYFDRYTAARGNPEREQAFASWHAEVRAEGDRFIDAELQRFRADLFDMLTPEQQAVWNAFEDALHLWISLHDLGPTAPAGTAVDFLLLRDQVIMPPMRLRATADAAPDQAEQVAIIRAVIDDWIGEAARLLRERRSARDLLQQMEAGLLVLPIAEGETADTVRVPDCRELQARVHDLEVQLRELNAVIYEAVRAVLPAEDQHTLTRIFLRQAIPGAFAEHPMERWFERVLRSPGVALDRAGLERARNSARRITLERDQAQPKIAALTWERLQLLDATGLTRQFPTATTAQLVSMLRTTPFALADASAGGLRAPILELSDRIDEERLALHEFIMQRTNALVAGLPADGQATLPALPIARPPKDLTRALREIRQQILDGADPATLPDEVEFEEGVIVLVDQLAIVSYDSFPESGRTRRPDEVFDLSP